MGREFPPSIITSTLCAKGMNNRKVMVRSECVSGDTGSMVPAKHGKETRIAILHIRRRERET
jgi:hypothetical protein